MKKIKNLLILAGGDSTRFWPLKNKSLFGFFNKPLVGHLINSLEKYSENIIVVTNQADENSIKKLGVGIKTVIQKDLQKGMAGAVLAAKDLLDGDCLIVNSNDIFDPKIIEQLVRENTEKKSDFSFVARKVNSYFPGGYLKFGEKGKLMEIVEKPLPEKIPSDLVYLVINYFKDVQQLISLLEIVVTQADDHYEHALTEFIKNKNVSYVPYNGFWTTLKYPWHVLPMMSHFLSSQGSEVKTGKNVKIADTAKIIGPCYIGDNTIVGDFAMVRESHIGKNCLIGGYSEVTRSYLGDGVSLHRNYVGDSILDTNVFFGAQVATANFRFDKKTIKSTVNEAKTDTDLPKLGAIIGRNSKIGVNSTLLPGVKIGRNTFIAPGYTIAEDVQDGMFIFKRKTIPNKHSTDNK